MDECGSEITYLLCSDNATQYRLHVMLTQGITVKLLLPGNDAIHLLTNVSNTDVYFKINAINGTWFYAKYADFRVGPDSDNYRLQFDPLSYTGNAGRYLNMAFSSKFRVIFDL